MVKILGVKVQDKIYSDFKEICEHERKTVSDVLYEVILQFIEDYKTFREAEGEDARMFREE